MRRLSQAMQPPTDGAVPTCVRCKEPRAQIMSEGPLAGMRVPIACSCQRIEDENRERRERHEAAKKLWEQNPVPRRFADASLESPSDLHVDANNADAIAAARAFVQRMIATPDGVRVPGTAYYGDKGVGKTHISYGIVNGLRKFSIAALIYSMPALDREYKALFGDQAKRDRFFRLLTTCPVLVIDDLGKEYSRDGGGTYSDTFFYDVINERYDNCLPIVVTTNFEPGALIDARKENDRFTAAIDRINEMIDLQWIAVKGHTRRY